MRYAPALPSRTRRPDAQQRGVVIVVVLFALILLAMMVFYVVNTGRHLEQRASAQHAADATALAGTQQIARHLNAASHHNIQLARLAAAVNVLDSLPLALDITITQEDENQINDVTAQYLAVVDALDRTDLPDVLRRELGFTLDRLGTPEQVESGAIDTQLRELDDLLRDNPELIQNMTHYRAPNGGEGSLWQAMRSADALAQAAMMALPESSALAAQDIGEANLTQNADGAGRESLAMMLPVQGAVPWLRGTFRDLGNAAAFGIIPPMALERDSARYVVVRRMRAGGQRLAVGTRLGESSFLDALGRADPIFSWGIRRSIEFLDQPETARRGGFDTVAGYRSRTSWAGGDILGDPPRNSAGWRRTRAYGTYGPQEAMINRLPWTFHDRLRRHMRDITRLKHHYVWPQPRSSAEDLSVVILSDWEVDLESDNDRSRTRELPRLSTGDEDEPRFSMDDESQRFEFPNEWDTIYRFAREEDSRYFIRQSMFLVLDLYHADQSSLYSPSTQHEGPEQDLSRRPDWFIRRGQVRAVFRPGSPNTGNGPRNSRWRDPTERPPFRRLRKRFYPGSPYTDYPEAWTYRQIGPNRALFVEQVSLQTNPYEDVGRYAFGAFPELGFETRYRQGGIDSEGNPILEPIRESHRYWRTRYYLLVGVNVGPVMEVRDPYEGFNPNSPDAPAPVALARPLADGSDPQTPTNLTYHSVAMQDGRAALTPGRFDGDRLNPHALALAQARVFNNHSHDLWTPMWDAQLVPLDETSHLADHVRDASTADSAVLDGLDPLALEQLADQLDALQPLSEIMLHH